MYTPEGDCCVFGVQEKGGRLYDRLPFSDSSDPEKNTQSQDAIWGRSRRRPWARTIVTGMVELVHTTTISDRIIIISKINDKSIVDR